MPGWWKEMATKPETVGLGLVMFVILCCLGFGIRFYLYKRPTSEEMERRRREAIDSYGKIGDGEIVEVEGPCIVYSYQVSGVGYLASQDVASLAAYLPADPMAMIGPVSLKFDRRNPANSIVVCERWSGFRYGLPARPQPDRVA